MANIPFICAWSVLAFARSLSSIYIAFIVMGFGLGLKEASSMAYAGEIWYVYLEKEDAYCLVFNANI